MGAMGAYDVLQAIDRYIDARQGRGLSVEIHTDRIAA